ncbi:MAG: hypothetical protein IJF18_02925 [Oscillospiraceae bacterium]|nr:hypothetical protein [Oscillospiraceae bacterium]
MKRLKFRCPFKGYGFKITIVSMILSIFTALGMLILFAEKNVDYLLPFVIIPFILIEMLAYLFVNRISSEEKELIAEADELCWESLDNWMYEAVKDKYRINWIVFIILCVLAATFFVVYFIKTKNLVTSFMLFVTFAAAIFIWLGVSAFLRKRWSAIDSTAECTVLKSHHIYTVKSYGRGRVYYDNYYVFYTPNGRLVLKKEQENCSKVCVIKFNGMITYIEYAEKRQYTYSNL